MEYNAGHEAGRDFESDPSGRDATPAAHGARAARASHGHHTHHGAHKAAVATTAGHGDGLPLTPDANGVVVLPAGATLDDVHVHGRDLVVDMPDGRMFVIHDGAVFVPTIVVAGVEVPPLNLAAYLTGNEPQPAAGPAASSGGNFADPVGPIQPAYGLGNLLPYTELHFPSEPQREVLPGLVNHLPDVTISTGDGPATHDALATVDEAGLPAQRVDGVVESAGSSAGNGSDQISGSIFITAQDGLASLTINGVTVTGVAGQQITTSTGVLTLGALSGDHLNFTYLLTDNTSGDNTSDHFTVVVTDANGDKATSTLTVNVADDVPTARPDTASVPAHDFSAHSGNVITGAGTTSGASGADTKGADGASVTGIHAGATGAFSGITSPIVGQYGTLNISGDGSFTYTRAVNTPGGVTDTFTYQITDGDGDTSNATLAINISNSPPMITEVPGAGDSTTVFESLLPPTTATRMDESAGSIFTSGSEGTSGTIGFTSPDGVGSVTVDGTVLTTGSLPQVVASDQTGTLTITSYTYDPVTGAGSIGYTYTLTDNTLNTNGSTVPVTLTVTDLDGDHATGNFNITIVDDHPIAVDDAAQSVVEGGAALSGNVMTNDTSGADGAHVTSVTIGGVTTAVAVSGTTVVDTALGHYTITAGGDWTFAPNSNLNNANGVDASFHYTITDGDGDTASANQPITVTDGAGPSAGEPITLTVSDQHLPDGSAPLATDSDSHSITFTPGSDAITSIAFAQDLSGLHTDNLTWTRLSDTEVVGKDSGTGLTVVTLDLAVNGNVATVTATQTSNYDAHSPLTGPDLAALGAIGIVATDTDGDTATGTVSVGIVDDVPSIGLAEAAPPVLTVDETTLDTAAHSSFAGVFTSSYGADGPGAVTYALGISSTVSGLVDTATG
ncbi:beta strand repeat-containing protein, partial [Novosphingobium sp.]|uniref:beta strand repeat-containing protein n=1 Tax=Novosphingobium sp. TaxID=1874826 RepID=UPI002B49A00A